MLGVYDYTVVLTYVSLMVSIGGMMFAVNGHLHLGVMCLAISGLCDMFDGKIARTKKNRTEVEKRFGIQIDSLSDIVCFGVAPAVLCYCFGMRGVIGVAILMFYVLADLIRLAWFNVMEEQRQEETTEKRECYQGLPITSMAIALGIIWFKYKYTGKYPWSHPTSTSLFPLVTRPATADKRFESCITGSLIQVILQLAAAAWMAKFSQSLCLNLSDTFSCYIKFLSNLFQCSGTSIIKTKTQTEHLLFSVCKST